MEENKQVPSTERVPPRERFAPTAIAFDLGQEVERLAAEAHGGIAGHRQITLYKHDQASISLFRFEKNGSLREHEANGSVFIQVLEGRLTLVVEGRRTNLEAGGLLVLAPGIPHDVLAEQESTMLLTVCVDR